jgi:hypothetical protein
VAPTASRPRCGREPRRLEEPRRIIPRFVVNSSGGLLADHRADQWLTEFDELMDRIAPRFPRVGPRRHARDMVTGMLAGLGRTNYWTIAEHIEQDRQGGCRRPSAALVTSASRPPRQRSYKVVPSRPYQLSALSTSARAHVIANARVWFVPCLRGTVSIRGLGRRSKLHS